MPVKNKNRQSNSGYEGVITGLNDEEKKVLEDAGIGGGDIWLDITPYLSEDMTSISQEGYDLVSNAFLPEVENPSNKYAGIIFMGTKLIYNGSTMMDDKIGLNFIANIDDNGAKGSAIVSIYNDKSVELIDEAASSSNKIWYDLDTMSGTITQNQYNEIKSLIDSNSLAGLAFKTLSTYYPLANIFDGGIFVFRGIGLGLESTGADRKNAIDESTITIKSDLSITFSLEEIFFPVLTQNLSNQSIISVKKEGYQENLTIGDGLAIGNGALKTNKYLKIDDYITITSSTSGTISQDGLRLISEKLLEKKIYEGVSFQGLEFAFYQYLLSDSCIFYGIVDSAQMKLDVDMATGNYTATPVTDIQIGTFGPYLPPTPKNVASKLYFVGLNNGELQWVQHTADDTLSNRVDNLEGRVSTLENEVSQYSGSISSLESRVSSLETASTSYAQASDVSTLDSRVSDIENTIGDINSILDNINGEVI